MTLGQDGTFGNFKNPSEIFSSFVIAVICQDAPPPRFCSKSGEGQSLTKPCWRQPQKSQKHHPARAYFVDVLPWKKGEITIRIAMQNDIPAIRRLVEYLMRVEEAKDLEFHTKKIVEERIVPSLDYETARTFIAEDKNGVTGVLLVELKNNLVASLAYIATEPEYQGEGVGSCLVGAAEEYAKENGIHIMQAIVHKDNKKSKEFHEKLGYEFFSYVLRKEI